MNPRDVILCTMNHTPPPYVPWQLGFTQEALRKLENHFGSRLENALAPHIAGYGVDRMIDIGNDCVQDIFGVIWDRSRDKDIGMIKGQVLPEPTLQDYTFPDVSESMAGLNGWTAGHSRRFRVFSIGFSLYERAWTMRGLESLMMDMLDHPAFVHTLLGSIADWNIGLIRQAVKSDIDAVHFGDDWGQQKGLQMGPRLWHTFIYPQLQRMYAEVKKAGKFVSIHSCGDVAELFDPLIGIGLNCFNPFQPEVMDVESLMVRYRGKLTFHGGLSTQRTLPFGTPDDVRRETRKLLELGRGGDYIFAPAHAVEGDVPLENMLAFIEELHHQPGF